MAGLMQLLTITRNHPLRRQAAFFIRQTYLDHYGAHVRQLPGKLIALVDHKQSIHCIAGLRDSGECFFSQHYLNRPVEQLISEMTDLPVRRCEIIEVTGFASRSPTSAMHFVTCLVLHGERLGYNWALFTATRRLGILLKRMGLPLIELAKADASRIPEPQKWGTYYEDTPKVYLIGRESLTSFLASQQVDSMSCGGV